MEREQPPGGSVRRPAHARRSLTPLPHIHRRASGRHGGQPASTRRSRSTSPGPNGNGTFSYPAYGFSVRSGTVGRQQLVVPVGEAIRFNLRTLDVIHAFWIPEVRYKHDLIPGSTQVVTLELRSARAVVGTVRRVLRAATRRHGVPGACGHPLRGSEPGRRAMERRRHRERRDGHGDPGRSHTRLAGRGTEYRPQADRAESRPLLAGVLPASAASSRCSCGRRSPSPTSTLSPTTPTTRCSRCTAQR